MSRLSADAVVALAAVLAVLALACRENLAVPGGPVASVTVTPESATVDQGDSVVLVAIARNAGGSVLTRASVTWSTSDSSVASVGSHGTVRGVAPGAAMITAASQNESDTSRVTVRPRVVGVRVDPGSATLTPGGSFPFAALAIDASGTPVARRTAEWWSSDTGVVRVSADGAVAALAEGAAWVRARSGAFQDSVRVRVVLASFAAVSAGPYHNTCATGPLGAFCWGYEGLAGSLGTGALLEAATTPVGVLGGEGFVAISAGDGFACGLTEEGAPYCWGTAVAGRLGEGSVDAVRPRPVAVSGQLVFRSVATGRRHACGLSSSGRTWCWGGNSTGALGVPMTTGGAASPTPVATDVTFVAIGAGSMHSCGLTAEGVAYCWGRGFQLGDSVGTSRSEPAPVHGEHRFRSLSVGWNHTCGLATDGLTYCWGASDSGELGSAASGVVTIPVAVADAPSFASVSAGYGASCGLLTDGTAYCWGWNNAGQLGTGDTVGGPLPRRVVGGHRFSTLSIGYVHTCGLGTDGMLYCWGAGLHGMLGDGSDSGLQTTPTRVRGQRGSPPERASLR